MVVSDGVTSLLAEPIVQDVLFSGEPEEVATRLLDLADDRGSPDNVTAVVAVVDQVSNAPKPYELPPELPAETAWNVQMRQTMGGIREVEDRFPGRGPMRWMRKQPWYPFRLWMLGSAYLAFLLVLFVLLR